MRACISCFVLLFVAVLVLACQAAAPSAAPDLSTRQALYEVVPVAGRATPTYSTATPWPTFTPHPLPSLVFDFGVPTVGPTPVNPPEPTPVLRVPTVPPTARPPSPLPTVSVSDLDVGDVYATPTPPVIQRNIPDLDIVVTRQAVFMSHIAEAPPAFPAPERVFYTRTARYIGWWVDFDYFSAPDDFEMHGLLRVLNITTGELVMYQEPFVLTHGRGLFLMLGDAVPGRLWFPGNYRFEAWDNRDRVMVHYDFEVRSGLLH